MCYFGSRKTSVLTKLSEDAVKRAGAPKIRLHDTTVEAAGAIEVRRELGRLVLPGQRHLHFTSESDRRRRELLDAIAGLSCVARVDSAKRLAEPDARSLALSALVRDAEAAGADSSVYIERVAASSTGCCDRSRQ